MKLFPQNVTWLFVLALVVLSLHCPLPIGAHEAPGGHVEAQTSGRLDDNVPWWYHWVHYGVIVGAMVTAGSVSFMRWRREKRTAASNKT